MKAYYIFLSLFLAVPLWGSSQSAPYQQEQVERRTFAQERWEKAVAGLNYDEPLSERKRREEEALRLEEAARAGEEGARRQEPLMSEGAVEAILKILSILAGVVIIAILLRAALGLAPAPRNRKIGLRGQAGSIRLEEIEENIHESDLDAYIQQALQQGDYTLAIRLYYLAILKELSLSKAIRWKKDKTNRQYLQEMQQSPLSEPFREVTRIFERAWYGSRPVGAGEYRQMEPKFRFLAEKAKVRE
jgi:hypothetical protein